MAFLLGIKKIFNKHWYITKNKKLKNFPNKDGLFEGGFAFSGGGGGEGVSQFDPHPPSYFKMNLSNINITLYNYKIVKQSV